MSIAFVLVSFPMLLSAASHTGASPPELPVCNSFCSSGEGRVWIEPFRPDDLLADPGISLFEREPYRGEDLLQSIIRGE